MNCCWQQYSGCPSKTLSVFGLDSFIYSFWKKIFDVHCKVAQTKAINVTRLHYSDYALYPQGILMHYYNECLSYKYNEMIAYRKNCYSNFQLTKKNISLTLSQCTLAGPVYTGMPLDCHWLTQCTLRYHWATQRILAGYTGTPLEKLSWNSPTLERHWRNLVETAPHWDATEETLSFAAYTGTPLEGLWQPTHAPTHMQSSIHASLKWQDGGTLVSKWTGLCILSLYLEF